MNARGETRPSPLVNLLVALLALESAALAVVAGFLVVELFVAEATSLASALALALLAALAAVWLGAIAVNARRGRAWTRGASLTWQALQVAVAIGSFQGVFARPDVGWYLLLPAVAIIVLLFTPAVVEALSRRGDDAAD
jgi:hypothetical protein